MKKAINPHAPRTGVIRDWDSCWGAINPHTLRTGVIRDWDSRWDSVPFQKSHVSQSPLRIKPLNTSRWNGFFLQTPHTFRTNKPWNSYRNLSKKYKK
ncbi:MAG: hypothetical protein HFJ28_05110 [Clostridia bacterium]|nr:hypothetical protein [Clostridia bacterium]